MPMAAVPQMEAAVVSPRARPSRREAEMAPPPRNPMPRDTAKPGLLVGVLALPAHHSGERGCHDQPDHQHGVGHGELRGPSGRFICYAEEPVCPAAVRGTTSWLVWRRQEVVTSRLRGAVYGPIH
jgi:hypothetical protein